MDAYEERIAAAEPTHKTAASVQALGSCSGHRLESRARQFVNGMIRHGTTTLEAKSGYGFDARSELKILRVQAKLNGMPLDIASTLLTPYRIPAEYASDAAGYYSWMCAELLPAIRRREFARFAGLRCGESAFDMAQSRRYLETARALGFQLKVHAGQHAASDAVRPAWIACRMPARRTWTCWRARTPWPCCCPATPFRAAAGGARTHGS
jgi:imidazolonepropionase